MNKEEMCYTEDKTIEILYKHSQDNLSCDCARWGFDGRG